MSNEFWLSLDKTNALWRRHCSGVILLADERHKSITNTLCCTVGLWCTIDISSAIVVSFKTYSPSCSGLSWYFRIYQTHTHWHATCLFGTNATINICAHCTHTHTHVGFWLTFYDSGQGVSEKPCVRDLFSSVFHMRIYTLFLFLSHTNTGSEQRSSVQSMGCLCWAGLAVRLNKRADSWFAIAIHQAEKREEGKEWSSRSGLCLSDTSLCMCCCFFPLKAGCLCVCFYVFTGTCVVACVWTADPAFKYAHKDVISLLWISSSILLLINH